MTSRRCLLDRSLWPALLALLALFALFELTNIDLWLQDHLFNFQTGDWLVDDRAPVPRFFFYDLPKILIIALAVALIVLAAGPSRWRERWARGPRRVDLWIVIVTLATGPGLIAISKATTNVFCPRELQRYGGPAPYVRVLEVCSPEQRINRRGRCFPAGHASGGFALLSLAGLARTRRGRLVGASVGVALGTVMGVYQMVKGAHFLSHTVVTALFCWFVFLVWRRAFKATEPAEPAEAAGQAAG